MRKALDIIGQAVLITFAAFVLLAPMYCAWQGMYP